VSTCKGKPRDLVAITVIARVGSVERVPWDKQSVVIMTLVVINLLQRHED